MTSSQFNSYAPVFIDGDDQYIFIQQIGIGYQAQAQLVLHVQSGEYRVRKVDLKETALNGIQNTLTFKEGKVLEGLQQPERRPLEQWFEKVFLLSATNQYLEKSEGRCRGQDVYGTVFPPASPPGFFPLTWSINYDASAYNEFKSSFLFGKLLSEVFERHIPHKEPQPLPHVVSLLGSSRIPCPKISSAGEPEANADPVYTTVLYFPFYNGGDWEKFVARSHSVYLRFIAQIGHGLQSIYDRGVVHQDLSDGNVFVHYRSDSGEPDFYIGDFGLGHFARSDPPFLYEADITYLRAWFGFLQRRRQNEIGPVIDTVNLAYRELDRVYQNKDKATGLPDLRQFLTLIDEAVAEHPITQEDVARLRGPLKITPSYYNSPEACLATAQIVGPFQIGSIRRDSAGNFQSLESVDEKVICRPLPKKPVNMSEFVTLGG